jgi:hypothetical protein
MLVKGDVKCLHCGFISGQWVGLNGAPVTADGYSGRGPETDGAAAVRCARCDGPVYLEDVEQVISASRLRRIARLRAQIAAIDARRGRAA